MLRTTALLLTVALAACVDSPPPDTSITDTTEQAICNNPEGCAPACTPRTLCKDADFRQGTCCGTYFWHKYPRTTTIGAVQCGNEPPNDQPICISTNKYDFVLVQVSCTTVTRWYTDGGTGEVYSVSETECLTT